MNIDRYINDGQDPGEVEKLLVKLQDMLADGEQVSYIAVQKKPAVTLFPDSIALTDKRIIFCRSTKLGLATDFEIFPLTAVEDISFKEGLLGAKVVVVPIRGEAVELAYIPKNQARRYYQLSSEALEKQRSENEPQVETASGVLAVPEADELALKLQKLKSLFERQLITQAEYENKKNELLSQL
ncbi:PH domain-containing protein [Parapedobacter sp. DT-150]|uniref:PH domain-containing protein n=1 Tax=Parapedobacter sp. DT-150 TaxID=3396162 RepID=UPI003F1B451B